MLQKSQTMANNNAHIEEQRNQFKMLVEQHQKMTDQMLRNHNGFNTGLGGGYVPPGEAGKAGENGVDQRYVVEYLETFNLDKYGLEGIRDMRAEDEEDPEEMEGVE